METTKVEVKGEKVPREQDRKRVLVKGEGGGQCHCKGRWCQGRCTLWLLIERFEKAMGLGRKEAFRGEDGDWGSAELQ